jgi:hypothetical protein
MRMMVALHLVYSSARAIVAPANHPRLFADAANTASPNARETSTPAGAEFSKTDFCQSSAGRCPARMRSAMKRFLLRALALAASLIFIPGSSALAHTLPISFLKIVPGEEHVHLELVFNPFELSFFSELDNNRNGRIDAAELALHEARIVERLLDALQLSISGKPVAAATAGVLPDLDSHHMTFRAHYPADARNADVTFKSDLGAITSGSHVTQVTYGKAGQSQAARLDMQTREAHFAAGPAVPAPEPAPPSTNTMTFRVIMLLLVVPGLAMILLLLAVLRLSWRHSHPA